MKKQITSWLLVLVLCLGLTVPAAAAEEKVTVGDKAYETVLDAILSEKEDKPVTVALSGDVALTAAVVLGESKVDDKTVTVASHNVTVDLNGYTLTGAKDSAVFEVQEGYTLTIVDNSEAKTGKLVSDAEEAVAVAEGATYNALPAGEEETPWSPRSPSIPLRTWRRPLPIMMPFCGRWNRESPKAMRTGLSGREPPAPTFIF